MEDLKYHYKYPHPAMTADAVVFGFDGRDLHVLLIERGIEPYKGSWALPGGFMQIDETIEECALRELREETNVTNVYLEQFHVFSGVRRDPRERVVTVAFYALVRKSDYELIAGDDAARANWFMITELPPLAFDHQEIITKAREHIQTVLKVRPIAFKLLDKCFTMPELQRLYEAINGIAYDRRNFAKKINASGFVHPVEDACLSNDESFGINEFRSFDIEEKCCEDFKIQCCMDSTGPARESEEEIIHLVPLIKRLRFNSPKREKPSTNLYTFDEDAFDESDSKDKNPFNF